MTGAPPSQLLLEHGPNRLRRCRHGLMLFNRHDRYLGRSLDLYGEFSEGEIAVFRQLIRPGDVVLDIGANIGAHTVFFAQAVGPRGLVHAFEPQRRVFEMLCANLALNSLAAAKAHLTAVGSEPGAINVPQLDFQVPNNFGGLSVGGDNGETVPVVTIDAMNLPACRFIKIDVEGMEAEVLRGAAGTLRRLRPALYVENDREAKSEALITLLWELDYRLYWHVTRLFNPQNFYDNPENVFGTTVSVNMLALPREARISAGDFVEITRADASWRHVPAAR